MKKLICLLLAGVMVLSMAGCIPVEQDPTTEATSPGGDTTAPIAPVGTIPTKPADPIVDEPPPEAVVLMPTDEEKAQIDEAMGKTVDLDSGIFRYYGTYSGYLILYEIIPCGERRAINMGGYTFVHTSDAIGLYGIRDGRAYRLELLYEADMIPQEQVMELYAVHTSYYEASEYAVLAKQYKYFYSDVSINHPAEARLTFQKAEEMDGVFYNAEGYHLRFDDVRVRYYGQIGECHIIFEEREGDGDAAQKIGPFTFHHYTGCEIWVIQDGQIDTLGNAYEQGIFSHRELEELYHTHRHYYWMIDDEGYSVLAYPEWEKADAASNGVTQVYAAAIQGIWELVGSFDEDEGMTENYNPDVNYGFVSDGRGYYMKNDDPQYSHYWHIAGATDQAVILMIEDLDYSSSCAYYITDPESVLYQKIIFWNQYYNCYNVYQKAADTAQPAVPVGTQRWRASAYYAMGTWVLADVEFSPGIPQQDEFYFDIDGTGYRIESGRKRPLIWWYADYSDSVLIKYVVEGEWVAYSLGYQLDPEDEEYKLMGYGLTWSGGIAVQRVPEAEEPGTPATPDGTVTFADAAEDILGLWALDHSRYEDTTVSTDPGDPLEFCFEEDGQGYVAYNGAEYPVTWQQTGEGSGWIAFECVWSVKTADGEIQYVYSLRYITDKNSDDYHQLIYDATDSYQVVMTKISGPDGTK